MDTDSDTDSLASALSLPAEESSSTMMTNTTTTATTFYIVECQKFQTDAQAWLLQVPNKKNKADLREVIETFEDDAQFLMAMFEAYQSPENALNPAIILKFEMLSSEHEYLGAVVGHSVDLEYIPVDFGNGSSIL